MGWPKCAIMEVVQAVWKPRGIPSQAKGLGRFFLGVALTPVGYREGVGSDSGRRV